MEADKKGIGQEILSSHGTTLYPGTLGSFYHLKTKVETHPSLGLKVPHPRKPLKRG